jgi:adenine-specific DNA-methyltransferase
MGSCRSMATLNWIGKEAVADHDKEVPFKLLEKVSSVSVGKESKNLIIHGDNLEALKALMPFYKGKVKCIYIDPPYNTGNEKWVYNDNVNSPKIREWIGKVVGTSGEDLTRRDKWLCMMYPRLKLLRDLLHKEGIIFISIDDNEFASLKILCDDIFEEKNFINAITVKSSEASGVKMSHTEKKLPKIKEYLLVYAKDSDKISLNPIGVKKSLNPEKFQSYAKYYSKIILNPKEVPEKWIIVSISEYLKKNNIKISSIEELIDFKLNNADRLVYRTNNKSLSLLKFGTPTAEVTSATGLRYVWWQGKQMLFLSDHITEGLCDLWSDISTINLNKEVLGLPSFSNGQKPLQLVERILELIPDKNMLVLDSFAGSGTTAHAVLQRNLKDKGNRKFILVELEKHIARARTAERIRRALKKDEMEDGFEYCELKKPLFNEKGQIYEGCSYGELASYIYFTETQTNIDKKKIKNLFVGESHGTSYYLIYTAKNKNDLTRSTLSKLKITGKAVIYADRCLVDEEDLKKRGIIFKQIPYEIKVY